MRAKNIQSPSPRNAPLFSILSTKQCIRNNAGLQLKLQWGGGLRVSSETLMNVLRSQLSRQQLKGTKNRGKVQGNNCLTIDFFLLLLSPNLESPKTILSCRQSLLN